MINGQSGEVQGQKPISWIKVTIAVVIALIVIAIVLYLVSQSESSSGELLRYYEYAMKHMLQVG
jgi:hypothetical protein